jgi:hypothetical protein
MPRYIRDDHEGELRPFEFGHPDESAGIAFEEYLLRRAAIDRAESERRVTEAVSIAVSSGVSWATIGQLLGTSAEIAEDRYWEEARRAS